MDFFFKLSNLFTAIEYTLKMENFSPDLVSSSQILTLTTIQEVLRAGSRMFYWLYPPSNITLRQAQFQTLHIMTVYEFLVTHEWVLESFLILFVFFFESPHSLGSVCAYWEAPRGETECGGPWRKSTQEQSSCVLSFWIFQGWDGYLPKNSNECASSGERF